MSDIVSHIAALDDRYPDRVPERLRRFLESGYHAKYPEIELNGFIRGPYSLAFDADGLADVGEFAIEQGIDDADDVDWYGDYGRYLPLAALHHDDVDQPQMFLMLDAEDDHQVVLFHYEGWTLYPLADSFEAFLAGLPAAHVDIQTGFRPEE